MIFKFFIDFIFIVMNLFNFRNIYICRSSLKPISVRNKKSIGLTHKILIIKLAKKLLGALKIFIIDSRLKLDTLNLNFSKRGFNSRYPAKLKRNFFPPLKYNNLSIISDLINFGELFAK